MVDKYAEGLFLVALVKPLQTLVGDKVRNVALITQGILWRNEAWVVVVALSGDNLPIVEARRHALQVPFTHNSSLITCRLQQLGEGLLRIVEYRTWLIVGKTVCVAVLTRNHTGAAGATQ